MCQTCLGDNPYIRMVSVYKPSFNIIIFYVCDTIFVIEYAQDLYRYSLMLLVLLSVSLFLLEKLETHALQNIVGVS